jgi:hypothetical protein
MASKRAHGNKYSPFELMFWRKPRLPYQIEDSEEPDEKEMMKGLETEDPSEDLQQNLSILTDIKHTIIGATRSSIFKEQVAFFFRYILIFYLGKTEKALQFSTFLGF